MNKKLLAKLLSTALVLGLIAPCSLAVSQGSAEAKKAITLKKKALYLEPGETGKIVVKNAPKPAKISYRSDDKTVATVSKKGVVKAKDDGKAMITVIVKKKKKTLKKLTLLPFSTILYFLVSFCLYLNSSSTNHHTRHSEGSVFHICQTEPLEAYFR